MKPTITFLLFVTTSLPLGGKDFTRAIQISTPRGTKASVVVTAPGSFTRKGGEVKLALNVRELGTGATGLHVERIRLSIMAGGAFQEVNVASEEVEPNLFLGTGEGKTLKLKLRPLVHEEVVSNLYVTVYYTEEVASGSSFSDKDELRFGVTVGK